MSNKAELLKKIKALDLREQERERQAAAESAGQFKVDPETGAIIEPESEAGDDD